MRDADHIQEHNASVRYHVVGLTLAGIVVLVAVFGLGFVVGGRATRLQQPVDLATDPLAQLDAERKVYDKLTFYQQLTAAYPGSAAPLAPPPLAPPAPVSVAAAAAAEGAKGKHAPPRATALPSAAQPLEKGESNAADPKAMAALSDGPASPGEFTVQVSSFQTREEAKAFASHLERKGFRPFVVAADLPSKGTWYRVRLGRFEDESQARMAKGVLARADIPAWVLRSD